MGTKQSIGSALGTLLLFVGIGAVTIFFFLPRILETKAERDARKQDDQNFKDRGILASIGRALFGDKAFEERFPDTTDKEAEAQRQKDLKDIADLNEEAQRLAKEEQERRKQAERQAEKDINVNPNQDIATRIDEIEKTIKNQQAKEEKQGKDKTFDRTSNDIKIFRFSEPIKTSKGTIVDFAINVQKPNQKETKQVRVQRKEEAIRQVKEAGLTPKKDSLGREISPILSLSEKTIKRIESDPRVAARIEASQLRRLGLR